MSGLCRAMSQALMTFCRSLPNVPTLVESGFPTLNAPVWFGVVVRTHTPAPIVTRLRSEFDKVIASEGYAQALEKQFMEVMRVPPETSEPFLASERSLWNEAVKLTGVSLD
mgnify:CR=1 FL=1